ncbi:hypothetical protein [Providencia sp. PROV156]|uniref:hypothetical protein n=1 Tax=Providencia sp. PROV156 TaxID=2949866 RepID=UPI002349C036|nr:hypothetical protein [Providencia sp. PROV156]
MKNPKLITKPFAQNGQKNAIPENYSSSMESNQATWDTGFGQITMIPVAAGGMPPKGQDFNGIFNQISENIVYLSKGGKFKFSADYAASIGGYPKGAILQSDDEKKEYQSIVDNNKVDFNTAPQSQVSSSWKLISTDDMLSQIAGKQPSGDYATNEALKTGLSGKQPTGDYATNPTLNAELGKKLDKTSVAQGTGSSTTQVMSQYAATKFFLKPGDFGFGGEAVTVPESTGYNGISQTSVIRGSGVPGSPPDSLAWGAVLHLQRSPDRSVQIGFWKGNIGSRSQLAGVWDDDWLLAYTEANTSKDRNGYLRTSTTTEDMQSVPIGASIIWNSSAPIPNNFWPNEGRSFSASEYPELAKIFTNLKLPDDRGYAIRAADNGRGIDTGRTVGTYQEDAMQEISGSITNLASTTGALALTGAFSGANAKPIERAVGNENSQYTTIEFKASRVAKTANETRMKNVAKILITRVK